MGYEHVKTDAVLGAAAMRNAEFEAVKLKLKSSTEILNVVIAKVTPVDDYLSV